MKQIKNMTIKELKEEWKDIKQHIEYCAYGTKEIAWCLKLEREMHKRGVLI